MEILELAFLIKTISSKRNLGKEVYFIIVRWNDEHYTVPVDKKTAQELKVGQTIGLDIFIRDGVNDD